jgi:hypothetical protein
MKQMVFREFPTWALRGALLLTVWLCGASTHAMTWTKIGETPEVALHVDRNAVEKDEAIRRVWEMQDMKIADPDGVMSRRYMNEYDCQYKMHRISQMDSFSGPSLTGKKMFTVEDPGYWKKIPPYGLFTLTYIWLCK